MTQNFWDRDLLVSEYWGVIKKKYMTTATRWQINPSKSDHECVIVLISDINHMQLECKQNHQQNAYGIFIYKIRFSSKTYPSFHIYKPVV